MATTVKRITLCRGTLENRPGALANALEPLAAIGASFQVLMAYKVPGDHTKAVVEVYPFPKGRGAAKAAVASGLTATSIPTLIVEGDDRPGLGAAIARALADKGINMSFLVTQVLGRRYTSVFGFEGEADAKTAAAVVKKVTAPKAAKKAKKR